ncbi:MAG: insulinase family protein [Planctomycetota bacterium]|nr:MAG: insulinase family protein [Planctomycetota bacterium]
MARTRSTSVLALLLLVALSFGAALPTAAAAQAAATKVQSLEGITEYRLDNGLQVLLYPDPSKPTVTVNLTVFVGSRHEGYGETGMAHLLEHMVFKGTPTHPHIPKALQERGARFNGTTWVDRTNYYETLPASEDNLNFALELEADRLVNSFIRQEDLFSEMTVVRNEFEAGENSPSNLLSQRIMSAAFDWHNYGKDTIGNRSDIERVPIKNLQAFYKKYYQPDNCMLVIAGKFDEKTAMQLVEKHFGSIPKPERELPKTYTEEPPQDGERSVTLRRVGDVGIVAAAYHVPSGAHEDMAALDVLANVMGSAPSGRLYEALVKSKQATAVGSSASNWHDPGVFQVEAEVRKGDSLDEVKDILLDVVESSGDSTFSEEEVERAKQKLLKQRELAATDTSRIAVQLSDWGAQGDWRLYLLHRDRLEKVTPEMVQDVAKRYLRRENRTLGIFIPSEKSEKAEVPPRPDLAALFDGYQGREEVALGEAFDPTPKNIDERSQNVTLSGGIKGILLPKKSRGEAVYLRLVLRYGDLESLKGRVTAAEMLPAMLVRGTKHLTRQQLQDELDKNGATLSASGSAGTAVFTIQAKRDKLPAVIDLLKQVLREPTLPEEEFEILRRAQLSSLEEQLTNPAVLAITRVRRQVSPYPKDDVRYVPTVEEEIERFKNVTRDDVQKLYDEFLGAQAGELAIVGDFDADECLKGLQAALADWTSDKPYGRIPSEYFPDVPGATERILTPDKANAVYMAGEAFPLKETDPQYAAMVVGNYVFGGGALSSRLGDRVRQKEGLSYGIGSYLSSDAIDARASLTISAICNPQAMDKVSTAIREELDRLLADGVTPSELAQAKQGYLQQQQVSRTSDATLAAILTENLEADRTMAFYGDLEKRISSLSPEQVLKALRTYVDPNKLVIVDAGDFAKAAAEGKSAAKEPAE